MKFKTVREGQQAVVYDHMGNGELLVGPKRVYLFRKRLTYLPQHTATQYQYLVVTDNFGFIKHIPGPYKMFANPLEYQKVLVKEATKIDANHSIVVYQKLKDSSVQRRIIQGPTVFVPTAEEWVHDFAWHGADPKEKGHMVAGLNTLQHLPCIPDQFYYNVRDVRTNDDTMLTVKLMIFYQLKDIIQMLEATHDPIADMINAVCSDVIAFAGGLTYDDFLKTSQKLSDLTSFPQLTQRAERVGYEVSKVVYRGYTASAQLQAMQDNAIQSRTKLRLNAEIENQRRKLADYRLQKEQARTNLKQDMEKSKVHHQQEMEKQQQQHKLELQELEHEAVLNREHQTTEAKLEMDKDKNKFQVNYLENLKDLDVDLTEYLVNQNEPRVDQEIQLSKISVTAPVPAAVAAPITRPVPQPKTHL